MKRPIVPALIATIVVTAVAAPAVWAAPTVGGEPSAPRGDDLLLEGLDDLIGGAPAAPAATRPGSTQPGPALPGAALPDAGRAAPPSWLPNRKELDKLMKDSLTPGGIQPMVGEDLGESPLVTLRSAMDRAGRLIASGDDGSQTRPTQEEVITQLDELIAKMEKQCQNCQGGGGAGSKRQQSRRSKPGEQEDPKAQDQQAKKDSKGKKPGKPQGATAASESTARLGKAAAAQAEAARRAEVAKRVWGRLPERLREQMLQSTTDEFLPEYRQEIEGYFERLAEDDED